MIGQPIIFVSAVSKELRSARQIVANQLIALGYQPKWQDIFGTEAGDLRGMLRRQVDESSGVIQLVGGCYGFEPPEPDAEFGRVSYTQYEALYARQQGKPVWYLRLDDSFPSESHVAESAQRRELQAAYRRRIENESHLWHGIDSTARLELTLFKLRDDLATLRRRARRWLTAVVALLLVVLAGVSWVRFGQRRQDRQLDQVQKQGGEILVLNRKLAQALRDLPVVLGQTAQMGQPLGEKARLARAYEELEKRLQLPAGTLERELPAFATMLLAQHDTSARDRAAAWFVQGRFAEAEAAALAARDQAAGATGQSAPAALEMAGWAALGQADAARALEHFRAAAALTSEEKDPLDSDRIRRVVEAVLDELRPSDELGPDRGNDGDSTKRRSARKQPGSPGRENIPATAPGTKDSGAKTTESRPAAPSNLRVLPN